MKTTTQIRQEARDLFRFCVVGGLLDESRIRSVVQTVLTHRRRGYISLLSHFLRFVRLKREEHTAEVASAVPIAADLRELVCSDLERLYGAGLNVRFVDNPELIGGMRVAIGSDVYDGTVKHKLALLDDAVSSAARANTQY